MKPITEPYITQDPRWPASGRHIQALFDAESVVVYQAYQHEIGYFAAHYGYFGGGFCLNRMSLIKPIYMWMIYRSGWGTKEGHEVTLAVRLRRDAFDEILRRAVHSTARPRRSGASAWASRARCRSVVKEGLFDQDTQPDTHGVAGQVAPQEAEPQDRSAERRAADRVDPRGVVQLADLDQQRDEQGQGGHPSGRGPGHQQPYAQEGGLGPVRVPGVRRHEARKMGGEAA
jgi:hypothetical protein